VEDDDIDDDGGRSVGSDSAAMDYDVFRTVAEVTFVQYYC
jgi:hypothetical protein